MGNKKAGWTGEGEWLIVMKGYVDCDERVCLIPRN